MTGQSQPESPSVNLAGAKPGSIFMILEFEGELASIAALAQIVTRYRVWKPEPNDTHGEGKFRIRGPADAPFEQIGPLLDEAERLGLRAGMRTDPPISGLTDQ